MTVKLSMQSYLNYQKLQCLKNVQNVITLDIFVNDIVHLSVDQKRNVKLKITNQIKEQQVEEGALEKETSTMRLST
jgi:hypothetical protein